ncbi:hypothetical protein A5906_21360 [Bradyrhizobium sacchari]|uniref:Uncharacterized protein n=1 Tax=Bradyrhizobium sacchari TaxID=1399419 RepID=A0A560KDT3_9BRAD|nr:hypothetical protein [Bradyrhizobium sacchari]OPZ00699.1 hypothetical protein A5906_21360 [Bradyrhizobium sacchari]TWB65178.1 hypothetical protein FBZ94_102723 [Bradyrhizobium sacchari]TWB81501.1 hypothetical protein FBZ95_102723 [Bradyrhizobium sacchari]
MSMIKRGTQVPARWRLLACGLLLMASATLPARADDGIVDVHALPQLEGAVADTSLGKSDRVEYRMPTPEAVTAPAVKKLLSANGWVPYVRPLEEKSATLNFKKGRQGLSVFLTQALGRPDQSVVHYSHDRIYGNVPFPDGALGIVFDGTRPYLGCIAPDTLEATLDFYTREMAAIGWRKLTPETAARWTNASLDETIPNGARVYYEHPDSEATGFYRQKPVMLTMTRRDDGKTNVEIRTALFALPAELKLDGDSAGFPRPDSTKTSMGKGNATTAKREMSAAVMADLPAVLAFYRRELSARGWRNDGNAALNPGDEVAIKVSTAEETGVLRLGRKYDFTMVSLATQLTDAAIAARIKAKKEADEKFFRDAEIAAKQVIAADEARRKVQAAALSDAPLNALANSNTPVPLPENAEGVRFEGNGGHLEFSSTASVKALTAFYRASLKPAGWKEQPSVINQPNMAVMEFSRSGKSISMTVMQMGPKVNVSASGSGLVMAAAKPAALPAALPEVQAKSSEPLKPDTESQLPVPTQRSSTSIATSKLPGTETPFRRELEARIPAPLSDVLAFYRTELGKLGWQEKAHGATVSAERAQIDFTSPQGPAVLKLGRDKGETTVNLAQKNPEAATKADIMPKPGQARVMIGNMGDKEASLTINKQTVKIAAGAGGPQSPKGPMLDLAPGTYQYALRMPGRPARTETLTVAAGDAWGLMVGPTGEVLPLQMY